MNDNGFTPTEQRILDLLSDGKPHPRKEVHGCLEDELSALSAIRPHLTRIRKKLRLQRHDVVCVVVNRRICYRRMGLLPLDGK